MKPGRQDRRRRRTGEYSGGSAVSRSSGEPRQARDLRVEVERVVIEGCPTVPGESLGRAFERELVERFRTMTGFGAESRTIDRLDAGEVRVGPSDGSGAVAARLARVIAEGIDR